MHDLLSQLDGSRAAQVAMLEGMTRGELEAVGSVEEVGWRRPDGKTHAECRLRGLRWLIMSLNAEGGSDDG